MRILIVTQVLDQKHPNLGFFVRWVLEFARQMDHVTVICLEKGTYHLPDNVDVYSLGKETRRSRIAYVVKFYRAIMRTRREYDVVFVHMNPEYVILGTFFWKFFRKKVGLWYLHKHVGLRLRVAALLADIIFTASKESFRLENPKVRVVGHGIDTDFFPDLTREDKKVFTIVSIGRLSRSKHHEVVIDAILMLLEEGEKVALTIVGGPEASGDGTYVTELEERAGLYNGNEIRFAGPVPHADLPAYVYGSQVLAHTGDTGSLDKVALEAMASGLPVVTSNDSVVALLEEFPELTFKKGDAKDLARALRLMMKRTQEQRNKLGETLRELVRKGHSLPSLIRKIESAYLTLP